MQSQFFLVISAKKNKIKAMTVKSQTDIADSWDYYESEDGMSVRPRGSITRKVNFVLRLEDVGDGKFNVLVDCDEYCYKPRHFEEILLTKLVEEFKVLKVTEDPAHGCSFKEGERYSVGKNCGYRDKLSFDFKENKYFLSVHREPLFCFSEQIPVYTEDIREVARRDLEKFFMSSPIDNFFFRKKFSVCYNYRPNPITKEECKCIEEYVNSFFDWNSKRISLDDLKKIEAQVVSDDGDEPIRKISKLGVFKDDVLAHIMTKECYKPCWKHINTDVLKDAVFFELFIETAKKNTNIDSVLSFYGESLLASIPPDKILNLLKIYYNL